MIDSNERDEANLISPIGDPWFLAEIEPLPGRLQDRFVESLGARRFFGSVEGSHQALFSGPTSSQCGMAPNLSVDIQPAPL